MSGCSNRVLLSGIFVRDPVTFERMRSSWVVEGAGECLLQ